MITTVHAVIKAFLYVIRLAYFILAFCFQKILMDTFAFTWPVSTGPLKVCFLLLAFSTPLPALSRLQGTAKRLRP